MISAVASFLQKACAQNMRLQLNLLMCHMQANMQQSFEKDNNQMQWAAETFTKLNI